jgi:uncharacterized membrane protein
MSFFQDFDFAKLLPEPEKFMNSLEGWIRFFVLLGPLVLLGLGLWYYFYPPKEANYRAGFRTYFGMGSVEAWRFSQRIAGLVFAPLGLVLTVIMVLICGGFGDMPTMDLVWKAVRCLLWEIGFVTVACLGINLFVMIKFTFSGEIRQKKA